MSYGRISRGKYAAHAFYGGYVSVNWEHIRIIYSTVLYAIQWNNGIASCKVSKQKSGGEMRKYILRRLVMLILVLFAISLISFGLSTISNIDAAEAYARLHSQAPTEEQIQEIREEMGLDQSMSVQYINWLGRVLKLDFGKSLRTENDVASEFMLHLWPTVVLVALTLVIIAIITILISLIASYYQNTFIDHVIRIFNIAGLSMPNYWFGYMMLLIFAVNLEIVPVVAEYSLKSAILPAVALAIPNIATNARILRSNLIENMQSDCVVYARARGLSEIQIMFRYVLKNSLAPMITVLGQSVGYLLAGTAVIENVFSWPGLGTYVLKAVFSRDYPVINMNVVFMAVVFVIFNLIADVINIKMNPKLMDNMLEIQVYE